VSVSAWLACLLHRPDKRGGVGEGVSVSAWLASLLHRPDKRGGVGEGVSVSAWLSCFTAPTSGAGSEKA
jgi:hypothetical protein